MAAGRKTGGRQKGTPNKRTLEFAESLEQEGLSVPEMAARFYRELQSPLLVVKELKNDATPLLVKKIADSLVNKFLHFKALQLEAIKLMALYAHPKPKEIDGQPTEDAIPMSLNGLDEDALLRAAGGGDGEHQQTRGD